MVEAPAAEKLAGLRVILAMPAEFVNAVPLVGVMAAKVASVLNVTTVLATGAPAASFTVALTVAGAAVEMEVTVAPAASASARVKLGAAAVVVVPVVVVVAAAVVPFDVVFVLPPPQPARKAAVTAIKVNNPAWLNNLVRKAAPSSNKKTSTLL